MRHSILSLLSLPMICAALSGCSPSAPSIANSARPSRELPELNVVREVSLPRSGRSNSEGLFLTKSDREHGSPVMQIEFAQNDVFNTETRKWESSFRATLAENYVSGGSGGLTKFAETGELTNVQLKDADAAIAYKGLKRNFERTYIEKTAFQDFTPGSLWILRVTRPDIADGPSWQFTVAVKLLEGFEPSETYNFRVKIQYKVLEYRLVQ